MLIAYRGCIESKNNNCFTRNSLSCHNGDSARWKAGHNLDAHITIERVKRTGVACSAAGRKSTKGFDLIEKKEVRLLTPSSSWRVGDVKNI